MAAKGQKSKDKIAEVLAESFGESFLGKHDNKYYINFSENGERVQISVTLTAVKNPIEKVADAVKPAAFNWENDEDRPPWEDPMPVSSAEPADLTQAEVDNLQQLMERLGL